MPPAIALCLLAGLVRSAPVALTEQWAWTGSIQSPSHPGTCMTPLVVQLTDDNRDGRIDENDDVDVVFSHFGHEAFPALITALDGRTGIELWTSPGPLVEWPYLAAGDIDGDGVVEIFGSEGGTASLVAFEHDGSLKWRSPPGVAGQWDAIGLADFDQDGTAEIYSGATVFNNDGSVRFWGTAGTGAGGRGSTSNAVDIDPSSPGLELLAGNTLYAADGRILWQNSIAYDGYTTVADFDRDGIPEIALAEGYDVVRMLGPDGAELTPPYAVIGGISQPAVADVDGDGYPELVLVSRSRIEVVAWSRAGFVRRWYQPTSDPSALAGASAYDIDGDGAAEIFYHDERLLMVFDGTSGTLLTSVPFPTATGNEVPVIADLDGDCEAEVLVGGCIGLRGSREQLVAYQLTPSLPPRAMWNQASYHATNVDDDGTIPAREAASWRGHNGWIQQTPKPQPRPTAVATSPPPICAGDTATLDATGSAGCAPLEHSWTLTGIPLCDWSTTPTCVVTPMTTTAYTLATRCQGAPCAAVATDTATVLVVPRPNSDAGADVIVCERTPVVLDASASGDLGCPGGLVFTWREGATIVRPVANDPTYVPPTTTPGVHTYEVTAACARAPGCESSDAVEVEVVAIPTAVAGPDQAVCEATPVQLDASGSIDRGCPGGLVFEWREGATVVRSALPDPTYVPPTTLGSRTYTVEARCAASPACGAADDVQLDVRSCSLSVVFTTIEARHRGLTAEIRWRTSSELGTVLFQVERGPAPSGPFAALAATLSAHGPDREYVARDPSPTLPSWYRVIEHTASGRGDVSAPVPLASVAGHGQRRRRR